MLITLELVRDTWCACYSHERLADLYDRPHTPLEVLTRNDGPWAYVPPKDRLWTIFQDEVLSDRTFRLIACAVADHMLSNEREAGRTPDPRSVEAVRVARLFADGLATSTQLDAAHASAAYAYAVYAYASPSTSAASASAYAASAAYAAVYADASASTVLSLAIQVIQQEEPS